MQSQETGSYGVMKNIWGIGLVYYTIMTGKSTVCFLVHRQNLLVEVEKRTGENNPKTEVAAITI